jgi:hypothetical protein
MLVVGITIPAAMFGYAFPYMAYHQTTITDTEVVIGRVWGFGSRVTYAVDRQTGNEVVILTQHIPALPFGYTSVTYDKSCLCIMTLARYSGDHSLYMSRQKDNMVYVSIGSVINRQTLVPYEQVTADFEQAQKLFDQVHKHYSHLVPST